MDIHVSRRDMHGPVKVYRSSMGAVVVDLGHDGKLTMFPGEAGDLRDQLTDVLTRP